MVLLQNGLAKVFCVMAPLAVLAEFSVMDVITLVAGIAIGRHVDFRLLCLVVAGLTLQSFMRPGEGILGLRVMIERPDFPAIRAVAGGTVRRCPQPALMVGIVMARAAASRDFREILARMTLLARHDSMQAKQGK